MKITVIGAGNAGCFTALHYGYYADDVEIELIHNPDIKPEKVGQATVLDAPQLLWLALGSDWYTNGIDGTPKSGVLYEGWGKKNDKFIHAVPLNSCSIHYSPQKLQETILSSGYFKVIEDDVPEPSDIDADYVFDCRGKPKGLRGYDRLKSPVNSAILGASNERDKDQFWTRAVATPDGWCFVIPNTTNTTSYGYIYNNKITPKNKAIQNFENMFGVEGESKLFFNSYIAQEPVIDDRVILNGNKLFFLEPLEASGIECYCQWLRHTFEVIVLKNFGWEKASKYINNYVQEIQNFILWHYQFGSKYDTPFWDYAKSFKINDSKFDEFLSVAINTDWKYVRRIQYDKKTPDAGYGQWLAWNFKNWYEGVTKCQ